MSETRPFPWPSTADLEATDRAICETKALLYRAGPDEVGALFKHAGDLFALRVEVASRTPAAVVTVRPWWRRLFRGA